ncbi:MAG TPA: hypothetical protein VK324_12635 [Tepidisphaeraceae bacterium]|nr:hypothetical protein [Tepidisphaeraceae bacterium]
MAVGLLLRARLGLRCCAMLLLATAVPVAVGGEPPATPERVDWKSRFLAEAPAEWAKLEAMVSRWQGTIKSDMQFAAPRQQESGRRTVRYCLNGEIGGTLFTVTTDDGPTVVHGSNGEYDFQLSRWRPDQKLFLSGFAPVTAGDEKRNDRLASERYVVFLNRLLVASSMPDYPMSRFIDGDLGRVKSAEPIVKAEGRTHVRIVFDQFAGVPRQPFPYPAWVVLDPGRHWAVVAFDRQDNLGGVRGTVEYQPDITDVAFPKKLVQETYDLTGNVVKSSVLEFNRPEPCELGPEGFHLEAFGIEVPKGRTTTAPAGPVE